MHRFGNRTCSAEFWAPACYCCCRIHFNFCLLALFTSGFYWFCVSLQFSFVSSRDSVSLPRSSGTNRKTIVTNNSYLFVILLVHEAEFYRLGRFFATCAVQTVQSLNFFTTHPFCGEKLKETYVFPYFPAFLSTEPPLGWFYFV